MQKPLWELWSPEFHGLDQVELFRSATAAEQATILQQINSGVVLESYCVEKMGVGYTGKMVLLADSLEERMIYGLFAADEARHLAQIRHCFPGLESQLTISDPFLGFLTELAESQNKALLLMVVQVVLEGWGVSHYRTLAQACDDPYLAQVYQGFLQDEHRHHAMGLVSVQEMEIPPASYAEVLDALVTFLGWVQVGPQRILAALELGKGTLSRSDKLQILSELEAESHSHTRLGLLKSLLERALFDTGNSSRLLQNLETHGCFDPFPPHQCI